MQDSYNPQIVQVVPFEDYTVDVYFDNGRLVRYDVRPFLADGVFKRIADISTFINTCTILNDTLAWDIAGNRNEYECIDIDPETLYALPDVSERIA